MQRIIIIVFTTLLLSITAFPPVFPDTVALDKDLKKISLGLHIEYLEDPEGKITIQDITGGKQKFRWEKSDVENYGFGYTKSAYWVRFTPENRSKENMEFYLEVAYPLLENIQVYIPENNSFRIFKTGATIPFHSCPYEYYNFVFPLEIKALSSYTLYMRFRTDTSMHIPLYLWSPAAFHENNYFVSMFLWMFYGIMIVMAVYNFCIFLSIREKAYIYYILYIISFGLFLMSLHGFAFQQLWPGATWWRIISIPFFVGIVNFSIVRFAMQYINVRQYVKTSFDKFLVVLLNVMAYLGIVLSVTTLLWHNFTFAAAGSAIVTIFNVIVGSIMLLIGIVRYHSREVWFFAAGFIICLMFCLMYAFMELNIITQMPINTVGLHIGAVINVAVLSLALADKINVMSKDLMNLNKHLEKKLQRCNKSHLKGIDVDEKVSLLKHLMEVDKIYRDEELSIKILAYEMSMTVHQLSELINNKLNSSYNNFINQYRVEEAKELLIDEPELSIPSIASNVGFGSLTNFFRIFKKSTSLTPKEFRLRVINAGNQST